MEDMNLVIALAFVLALVLFFLYSVGRILGVWTWSVNWLFSSREEKVNLTRVDGHYNANGYLVPAESAIDINLCHSGSFKRFETVDHEFVLEMSDFTTEPTQPQPPEQRHEYPEDFELPFRSEEDVIDDLYANPQPSCSGYNYDYAYDYDDDYDYPDSTTVFVSSSPTYAESSTAYHKYPMNPYGPSTSSAFFDQGNYECDNPDAVAGSPERPSPPVFDRVVPPPIPPRIQPPPIPPRRIPLEKIVDKEDVLVHIRGLVQGVSFESLSSDTSVAMGDLETAHVTGYLCVSVDFINDAREMTLIIWEARDLSGHNHNIMNTFARVSFFPDSTESVQTKICRNSSTSTYNEKFFFPVGPHDYRERTLNFYVFSAGTEECVLIGEGELRLSDVAKTPAITTWITLTDTGQLRTNWGEIMFSLNYLPTAEKLTVVIVRAQNLSFPDDKESGDSFVKVYLLKRGKKILKKRTSTRCNERNPIFNEAMIFNVTPSMLENMQVRVTVAESTDEPRQFALGHVFIGAQAIGKSSSHWFQMRDSPRRPISMWHFLAR